MVGGAGGAGDAFEELHRTSLTSYGWSYVYARSAWRAFPWKVCCAVAALVWYVSGCVCHCAALHYAKLE